MSSVLFLVWTGAHEEIDYSAKLKFSDDEGDEDGEDERTETQNDLRCVSNLCLTFIILNCCQMLPFGMEFDQIIQATL